ncbi:hypothetical protein Q5705_17855 [Kosakonia sp. H02]|nr:hypothetical protein Q5705_17855 [Kosakonia sp. H02]
MADKKNPALPGKCFDNEFCPAAKAPLKIRVTPHEATPDEALTVAGSPLLKGRNVTPV